MSKTHPTNPRYEHLKHWQDQVPLSLLGCTIVYRSVICHPHHGRHWAWHVCIVASLPLVYSLLLFLAMALPSALHSF